MFDYLSRESGYLFQPSPDSLDRKSKKTTTDEFSVHYARSNPAVRFNSVGYFAGINQSETTVTGFHKAFMESPKLLLSKPVLHIAGPSKTGKSERATQFIDRRQ